ncbi:MAG: hypothetical protein HYZ14_18010 [Bacteroidetes bacterium]|nr:hypothetical protein [Bacteroidota bacterium]
MNKYAKILLLTAVAVLFIVLIYFFGGSRKEQAYVSDNWEMTYDPSDKGPYGTYMLKELLDTAGLFGNFLEINKKLEEVLEDKPGVNDIYFFAGDENFLESESVEFLYNFILKGNTVFMSCHTFPAEFMDYLVLDPDSTLRTEPVTDSVQYFRFTHSALSSKRYTSAFINNNKRTETEWEYFNQTNFDLYDDDTIFALGSNTKGAWNFVKIKYGEGSIFLHSTPYLFTNISLMKRDGFEYAEKVLAHIPPGRIQWDRYNLTNHFWEDMQGDGGGDGSGGSEKRQSILQFILDHPPLVWSMILLLVGAILYGVFKGKRMQKIIPAAESKENTSLGYINTLSSLYLQENKHAKLIRLKERTFLNFIAEHYYIITKEVDDKFISKVAIKSQIEKEKIKEIFDIFRKLEKVQDVTDDELILLHQKIEYFYKKCR